MGLEEYSSSPIDMSVDLQIVFVLTLLIMLEGRFVLRLANLVFWSPYLLYVGSLFFALATVLNISKRRVEEWNLGYTYKICIKAFRSLIKRREVQEIMKGVRFTEPHDFVCKCDESVPEEDRTIFRVKFLTKEQQAEIRDIMYSVKGIGAARQEKFLTGSAVLKALEYGLVGWKNFKFDDDVEIPFNRENFSCIPPAQRDELANHIRGIAEGEL